MSKNYDTEKRYIRLGRKETTVAMERVYWGFIDATAQHNNVPWTKVITQLMELRPADYDGSRIGWIRCSATVFMVKGRKVATQGSVTSVSG